MRTEKFYKERKEAGHMETKKKLLTYAGLKALEDELENLKVVKRKEVAQKLSLIHFCRCRRSYAC